MNILLSTDNNYVQHCSVTIASILKNNDGVHFFIFTQGLSSENLSILNKLVSELKGSVDIILIDNNSTSNFPMSAAASDHISIATYYRLFAELLIPDSINKIIYMDCDIVVNGSLHDLWNTNIDQYAMGAVYQYNEWSLANGSHTRLNYPEEYGYFNAGVLLMNLDYWRKWNVTNRLFSFIKHNYDNIISHDQDTLNAVLHKEILPLDFKWNLLPFFLEDNLINYSFPENVNYKIDFKAEKGNPTVIHYVFKPKPWEYACNHPFKKLYYYYLSFTPWKSYRPKFMFRNYIMYGILPKILKIRRYFLEKYL